MRVPAEPLRCGMRMQCIRSSPCVACMLPMAHAAMQDKRAASVRGQGCEQRQHRSRLPLRPGSATAIRRAAATEPCAAAGASCSYQAPNIHAAGEGAGDFSASEFTIHPVPHAVACALLPACCAACCACLCRQARQRRAQPAQVAACWRSNPVQTSWVCTGTAARWQRWLHSWARATPLAGRLPQQPPRRTAGLHLSDVSMTSAPAW